MQKWKETDSQVCPSTKSTSKIIDQNEPKLFLLAPIKVLSVFPRCQKFLPN